VVGRFVCSCADLGLAAWAETNSEDTIQPLDESPSIGRTSVRNGPSLETILRNLEYIGISLHRRAELPLHAGAALLEVVGGQLGMQARLAV
jgi:hypothetical protein